MKQLHLVRSDYKQIRFENSEDISVRLWQTLFENAPLKRFPKRVQGWITLGRNSYRHNISRRMKDLVLAMRDARMSEADVRAIGDDITSFIESLYAHVPATPEAVLAASLLEAKRNANENLLQDQLNQQPTKENALAYAAFVPIANGARSALGAVARRLGAA